MRNNEWLASRLVTIRQEFFSDVPVQNTVFVRFGRQSRTRLGSIIARPRKGYQKPVTFITINSLLKDLVVPEYVIDATLAHEFAHYTHGFHSPLEQKYKYPHRGDVVNKELRKRGIGEILEQQNVWLKAEYTQFLRAKRMI